MPGPTEGLPAPVPETATQQMVPMRDGIRLATDVYLPAAEALPAPAVVVRLPYDKNSRYVFMERIGQRLTDRGYVLVVQDVRGKFRSEGSPTGPLNEVRDGYDTIDWASRQPWSNGRIGTFGDSYYGFTQWAAASADHPALCAMVPRVTSCDIPQFTHARHGDVVDVPWLQFVTYIARAWSGPYMHEVDLDWTRSPLTDVFEQYFAEIGQRSDWYDLMVPRVIPVPVYPEGHPHDARPVPALHCVGWFDNVATLSMRDYTALAAKPDWGPLQYLHADSVDHENYHLSLVPVRPADDHDTDDDALERMLDVYLGPAIEFFDVFLARRGDLHALPKVRWHLGHVGYQESTAWPPPEATQQTLFLSGLDEATRRRGRLIDQPPTAAQTCTWEYDPDDLPVSTVDNSFAFLFEYPDEASMADLPGVVTFEGPELTEPVDLAGPVDLWVRVDSTAPTTDVFAKLCDRTPGGEIRQIARGQGVLTVPGPDGLARIEMGHTGYRVRPGHRLHLQITSSDYPEYPPNPGTSENRWTAAQRVSTTQTLHTGPAQPSRLTVHVLPVSHD